MILFVLLSVIKKEERFNEYNMKKNRIVKYKAMQNEEVLGDEGGVAKKTTRRGFDALTASVG